MTIKFPPLHKNQQIIAEDKTKFKVLACGRRFGKSWLAKQMALDRAINKGQNVWLVYPTFNTSLPHWREFTRQFTNAPFVTHMNQQNRIIEFDYQGKKGRLVVKSADKYHNLRGDGLDFAVLDEVAFMPENVWYEVVFPSLADKNGDAIFISTPYGRGNWFYKLYMKGAGENPEPNWKSWRMPTSKNPFVPKTFLQDAKKDMPNLTYRQEFMAEFADNAGGVFNNLDKVCTGEIQEPVDDEIYVFGVDWGRKNDYTVVSIFNRYTGKQMDLVRFTDISYDAQLHRLEMLYKKWQPSRIIVEENNMGQVLVESLKKDMEKYPVRIKPVYMTNVKKRKLIEDLSIAIEKQRIELLSYTEEGGRVQYEEMSSYELKRTAGGTQVTYSAPKRGHDDTVIATSLAVSDLKLRLKGGNMAKTFFTTDNKFY